MVWCFIHHETSPARGYRVFKDTPSRRQATQSILSETAVVRYVEGQLCVFWRSPLSMAWTRQIQNSQVRKVSLNLPRHFRLLSGGRRVLETISIRQKDCFLFPMGRKDKGSKSPFCWKAAGNFLKLPFLLNFTLQYLGSSGPRQFRDAWKWKE